MSSNNGNGSPPRAAAAEEPPAVAERPRGADGVEAVAAAVAAVERQMQQEEHRLLRRRFGLGSHRLASRRAAAAAAAANEEHAPAVEVAELPHAADDSEDEEPAPAMEVAELPEAADDSEDEAVAPAAAVERQEEGEARPAARRSPRSGPRNRAFLRSMHYSARLRRDREELMEHIMVLEEERRFLRGRQQGPPEDYLEARRMELEARRLELEARRMALHPLMDIADDEDLHDLFPWDDDDWFWHPFRLRRRREYRPRPPPPPETPPQPHHIREYEDFNRTLGMTFSKVAEGVERSTASNKAFDPQSLFIKRVTACIGWAVHGLVFEMFDGKRMGAILVDFGDRSLDLSDKSIAHRSGVGWTDIDYGDYIVGMHGDRLADPAKMWFCHTLVLEFASGKTVRYEAKHEPWRGLPFSYSVPQPCLVYRVAFKYEQNEDMLGLKTSIHLPVSKGNMPHLPSTHKQCVLEILVMAQKIDTQREAKGGKPLGSDVWWRILGMLTGFQLLPPTPSSEAASAPTGKSEDR